MEPRQSLGYPVREDKKIAKDSRLSAGVLRPNIVGDYPSFTVVNHLVDRLRRRVAVPLPQASSKTPKIEGKKKREEGDFFLSFWAIISISIYIYVI